MHTTKSIAAVGGFTLSVIFLGCLFSAHSAQESAGSKTSGNSLAQYQFKESTPADEALIFTPPGFNKVGIPTVASGEKVGRVEITVRDQATGKPTFCRVNVVGPDGN